jgi:hypothetical protein
MITNAQLAPVLAEGSSWLVSVILLAVMFGIPALKKLIESLKESPQQRRGPSTPSPAQPPDQPALMEDIAAQRKRMLEEMARRSSTAQQPQGQSPQQAQPPPTPPRTATAYERQLEQRRQRAQQHQQQRQQPPPTQQPDQRPVPQPLRPIASAAAPRPAERTIPDTDQDVTSLPTEAVETIFERTQDAPRAAPTPKPTLRSRAQPRKTSKRVVSTGKQTRLMRIMRHPESLRQAIVIKELLDVPVSLRDRTHGHSYG